MSATDACATDTLAPEAPSTSRPMNSSGRPMASPVNRLPMAVPTSDTMSTGLRPTESDSRPHSGDATSCASEKAATSAPATAGLAW